MARDQQRMANGEKCADCVGRLGRPRAGSGDHHFRQRIARTGLSRGRREQPRCLPRRRSAGHDGPDHSQLFTMEAITTEQVNGLLAAVKAGTGLGGWHGGMADSFREQHRVPVHGRRAVGGAPRQHHRLHGADHPARRPDHGRARRLRHALRAVLHARRPVERGAGDHDLQRRARPLDRRHGDAGGLEAAARARGASSTARSATWRPTSTCPKRRRSLPADCSGPPDSGSHGGCHHCRD